MVKVIEEGKLKEVSLWNDDPILESSDFVGEIKCDYCDTIFQITRDEIYGGHVNRCWSYDKETNKYIMSGFNIDCPICKYPSNIPIDRVNHHVRSIRMLTEKQLRFKERDSNRPTKEDWVNELMRSTNLLYNVIGLNPLKEEDSPYVKHEVKIIKTCRGYVAIEKGARLKREYLTKWGCKRAVKKYYKNKSKSNKDVVETMTIVERR